MLAGGVVVGEELGEGGRNGLGLEFLGVAETAALDEPAIGQGGGGYRGVPEEGRAFLLDTAHHQGRHGD
jgi:hypothetical protein